MTDQLHMPWSNRKKPRRRPPPVGSDEWAGKIHEVIRKKVAPIIPKDGVPLSWVGAILEEHRIDLDRVRLRHALWGAGFDVRAEMRDPRWTQHAQAGLFVYPREDAT